MEPGVYPTHVRDIVAGMSVDEVEAIVAELDWEVVPDRVGPCWDLDPTWDGPRDPDGYILPKHTIGWQAIYWIERNLLADETDEHDQPLPFTLTREQMRFILWFYAIDETGRFAFREVVLQRLKGWGKDPLAAVIAAVEFVGPCRFKGWVQFRPEHAAADAAWAAEHGLVEGDPYAVPHPRAWIQTAAVSLEQTGNTMTLFQGLFSPECMKKHGIDVGKTVIYAYGGQRKIQAVTSSPRSLEGNRPTLVIKNETHHWQKNNDGIAMADAIERNATKAKGGAARTLSITNAPEPSEDSVALRERKAYDDQAAGLEADTGTLYDSLEAPATARLRPIFPDEEDKARREADRLGVPEISREVKEAATRRYLSRVLAVVAGGAWWLDIPSLVNSILNPRNAPSRSRRFWYNQITTSEDAWVDPRAVDAAISELAKAARDKEDRDSRTLMEAGWLVLPDEPIVMFFDGSKSDDSTALVGCRISDGYIFTIGVWQKPRGKRGDGWLAPREAVHARVIQAFSRFDIVAFWADPSHAKDDEDSSRYWDGYIDRWMTTYKDRLDPLFWAIKGGHRKHAIMFDMAGPEQQKMFIAAAETFVEDIEQLSDIEEFAPAFEIDGHPALVSHLKNAVRYPTGWGVSLMKDGRESLRKIDLAVCAVGARMLRRVVMLGEVEEEDEVDSTAWGFGW